MKRLLQAFRSTRLAGGLAIATALAGPVQAEHDPVRLRVVGGLGGVEQYTQFEEPFWRDEIRRLSNGRISATIHPFDRSGLRGPDMLQLIRLGVVPFGTAILTLVSNDEPELSAVDLAGLAPDLEKLRRIVAAYRGHIETVLRTRYDIELLSINVYPAQVIFCSRPFTGLGDLRGRRIRTSSVSQSDMMTALGAIPVVTPFAEVVAAIRAGTVDCAITGTLSGFEIGLPQVTSSLHGMAVSWGVSMFGANSGAWRALPDDLRAIVSDGLRGLESRIWDAAEASTRLGIACNVGEPACNRPQPGRLRLVATSADDEVRRRALLMETVLPKWLDRCGASCSEAWNAHLAPVIGIQLPASGSTSQ